MCIRLFYGVFFSLLVSSAFACDVSLSAGGNIQNSLDGMTPGQTLCLASGSFYVNQLQIPNGLRMLGAGKNATTIYASGTRGMSLGDEVELGKFTLKGWLGSQKDREYGMLAHGSDDVLIWTVEIRGFLISIGANGASDVRLKNIHAYNNGDPNNETAGGTSGSDPHLWINNSNDVLIQYGRYEGRLDGYKSGGDGEIGVYNSNRVTIDSVSMYDSGASGLYLVNCDNCKIINSRVSRSEGWGLDIVGGSENFYASNNEVLYSRHGAVVFHEYRNGSGVIVNNTFTQNNTSGESACRGINVRTVPSYIDPATVITAYGNLGDNMICQQ